MLGTDELQLVVQRLRKQGSDDSEVEVKECAAKLSGDIWETVSAFANTAGGLIILGLSEKQGFKPVNSFDLDRVRDQFIAGMGDGGQLPAVGNAPEYDLSRGEVDGSPALLIQVKELDLQRKPCYIVSRGLQRGSYKRVDDKDILLSATELYEIQSALLPSDADSAPVPESGVDDLDFDIVKSVIASCKLHTPRMLRGADTQEKQLERLNITNKQGKLRLAGLLAAGMYPQQFFPKLVIDVAVHPDIEKSAPNAPRFLDRQICDGPAALSIEDALNAIGRNLRKSSRIVGAGRIDDWEIPEGVLREALANAIIHREYSPLFVGQSVSVDIFPDRIEVLSPGGLWGGKTPENLADGESRCRNTKLMSLMRTVPLKRAEGNVAESQGSGVISMIREMESRALGRPKFVAKPDSFKVVLMRHGVEAERNRAWLSAWAPRKLESSEELLLMTMKERGGVLSVSDARSLLKWDSDDIRSVFHSLEEDGMVRAAANDKFELQAMSATPSGRLDAASMRNAILGAMVPGEQVSARDLATALDVDIAKIRYFLPQLIQANLIIATAGVHSRNRRYELVIRDSDETS